MSEEKDTCQCDKCGKKCKDCPKDDIKKEDSSDNRRMNLND